jgi:hypothetical protein
MKLAMTLDQLLAILVNAQEMGHGNKRVKLSNGIGPDVPVRHVDNRQETIVLHGWES